LVDALIAERAERDPIVRRVRGELLVGGVVLEPVDALKFLESPAPRFLGIARYKRLGRPESLSSVLVENVKRVPRKPRRRVVKLTATLKLKIYPGRPGRTLRAVAILAGPPDSVGWLPLIAYPVENDVRELAVFPDSVLDRLRVAGELVAHRYFWSKAQAVWFILTGACPLYAPVVARFRERRIQDGLDGLSKGRLRRIHDQRVGGRLFLEIEPWVSAETVFTLYRGFQRSLYRQKRRRVVRYGQLELYRFARPLRQQGLAWREIHDRWKKTPRGKANPIRNWRNFSKAFGRVQLELLAPVNRPGSTGR
jgi:hypothetical protein